MIYNYCAVQYIRAFSPGIIITSYYYLRVQILADFESSGPIIIAPVNFSDFAIICSIILKY